MKSYELERWIKLIDIYYYKKHIGKNINTKNHVINFAEIIKDLNIKRNNKNKLRRINIIIDWLKALNSFPNMEEKLNLIKLVKINLISI